jgi:nitrous oxidase accessory protein NosD
LIPVNCGDELNVPGGHYILTDPLSCPLSPTAVVITAPDVKLDLNGYTIRGSGVNVGVLVKSYGAQIHGGTVAGFGQGIHLSHARDTVVEKITLVGNVVGIFVENGENNTIRITTSLFNEVGIELSTASVGNTVATNAALNNTSMDLVDSAPCGNFWSDNTFTKDSEGDGPRVGCIR